MVVRDEQIQHVYECWDHEQGEGSKLCWSCCLGEDKPECLAIQVCRIPATCQDCHAANEQMANLYQPCT